MIQFDWQILGWLVLRDEIPDLRAKAVIAFIKFEIHLPSSFHDHRIGPWRCASSLRPTCAGLRRVDRASGETLCNRHPLSRDRATDFELGIRNQYINFLCPRGFQGTDSPSLCFGGAAMLDQDLLDWTSANYEAIAVAAEVGPDAPIPSCPGWTMNELLSHASNTINGWFAYNTAREPDDLGMGSGLRSAPRGLDARTRRGLRRSAAMAARTEPAPGDRRALPPLCARAAGLRAGTLGHRQAT